MLFISVTNKSFVALSKPDNHEIKILKKKLHVPFYLSYNFKFNEFKTINNEET